MSDWSKRTARKFLTVERATKQEETDRREKADNDARLVKEQKILDDLGPDMWAGLCEAFKQGCDELNADIGRKVINCNLKSVNAIKIILTDGPKQISLIFVPSAHDVEIHGFYRDGEVPRLHLKLDSTGCPRFSCNDELLFANCQQIVHKVLEKLVL
jgi:hypothetical protein